MSECVWIFLNRKIELCTHIVLSYVTVSNVRHWCQLMYIEWIHQRERTRANTHLILIKCIPHEHNSPFLFYSKWLKAIFHGSIFGKIFLILVSKAFFSVETFVDFTQNCLFRILYAEFLVPSSFDCTYSNVKIGYLLFVISK